MKKIGKLTTSRMPVDRIVQKAERVARGERLKRVRGMANLSRAAIEERYDISADTLKNWELGRHSGLTERGAQRILAAFELAGIQCSMGWLLYGIGAAPIILSRPGNRLSLAEERASYTVLPLEIQLFYDQHPNAFYMEVIDDGMEPNYFKGDYVAGERHYGEDIQKSVGKYCIVETQMGEILLRRVRQGHKEGQYSLQCINLLTSHPTPFIYDAELASVAPVILHLRMDP